MKIKIYSLVVSLVFIPVAVLGQFLGSYLGYFLYFIYDKIMFLNLPVFIYETAPLVISGVVAGGASAFSVSKIYKSYDLIFVTIIPLIIVLIAFLGDLSLLAKEGLGLKSISPILRELATISIYYYFLKNKYFLKQ